MSASVSRCLALAAALLVSSAMGQSKGSDAGAAVAPRSAYIPPVPFDVPEPLEAVDVPGAQRVEGIPVVIRAARSGLTTSELMEHYLRAFSEAKLFVPPQVWEYEGLPEVKAFDPDRGVGFTIFFMPHEDGSTTVLSTAADLGARETVREGSDFAPLYPGARSVVRTNLEQMQVITFEVTANDARLSEYYSGVLGQAGYKKGDEPGTFEKGADRIRIFTRKEGPNTGVVLTHTRASAEGAELRR